ncbi:MAG: LD-carboxypeptidase [Blastocatellia bacterium]|nr:LD-carboxypeptidase [Blastocatellia bacterium]
MMKPTRLKPGDTIGLVAPASNLKPDLLHAGIAELERLGYKVRYRPDIVSKERFTAGSIERRVNELHEMWANPEVDAIFAARGGYGCLPLLPHLDPTVFRNHPKVFLGYSDITVLHCYLWKTCELVTFHGPMVAKDFAGGADHYDLNSFTRVVGSQHPAGLLSSPETRTLVGGGVGGRLVGGCLTLVASLIGTPWQLDTTDSILFLEDTGTKPYQIDRLLQQLKLAGMFDQVRGVVFGEMSDCQQHRDQGYELDDILFDALQEYSIPILSGWRSGHSEHHNRTLPLGVSVVMNANAGTIEVLEAACL